jgi:CMP-N-acetylneuraminic acid synthetase
MEILSIIPARGGSVEIPRKNLVKIQNKPLIYFTINASLKSSLITRTVVSTDDKEITNIGKKLGAEVIQRPKRLTGNKTQLEPVLLDILKKLEKNENYNPDGIILLQPTSPMRNFKHIDEAIKLFYKEKYDSVLSGYHSHHFFWEKKGNIVIPKNYNPEKRPNRQDKKFQFIENGAIYITNTDLFKKNKSRLFGKIGIYEMPENLSLDLDTKEDLKTIKQKMES